MQMLSRHGGANHFVRPDAISRTSVLQPTGSGYEPEMDVHDVATEFTNPVMLNAAGLGAARPYTLLGRGPYQLLGPGAFFKKIGMRWRAWKSRRAYNKAIANRIASRGVAGLRDLMIGEDPSKGAAYVQVGKQIAPDMVGRAAMVAQLTADGLPDRFAQAQGATSSERWWNARWNG